MQSRGCYPRPNVIQGMRDEKTMLTQAEPESAKARISESEI